MTTEQPALFTPQEAKIRTELYLKQRLDYQLDFYRSRIEEYRLNASAMLWLSAILMGISGLLSFAATSTDSPLLAVFTALLPALATAVASFQAVYQWERQATIYRDVEVTLESIRLMAVPKTPPDQQAQRFQRIVLRAEEAFRAEAGQWGQLEGALPLEAGAKEGDMRQEGE